MVSAGCLGSRAKMEVWHVWVGVGVDPSLPSLAVLCPAALAVLPGPEGALFRPPCSAAHGTVVKGTA